jgi:SAM-dependent methyltransferase
MAALVMPGGQVVGIDASNAMVAEAQQRTLGLDLPVSFAVAELDAIPFADGEFDGCRAERVFMHIRDSKPGLAELARVLRPGGRIAVFEPDFVSMLVDADDRDVTRAVSQARMEMTACGDIGRRLFALFRDCGLDHVLIEPWPNVLFDFASANRPAHFVDCVDFAVSKGDITAEQGAAWLADLHDRDRSGRFFMATIGFIASATKPA